MGSSGSFVLAWVNLFAPSGRRVHSGSRGFTRARLVVEGIIVIVGSLRSVVGSSALFWLSWARLGVVRYIPVRVG